MMCAVMQVKVEMRLMSLFIRAPADHTRLTLPSTSMPAV